MCLLNLMMDLPACHKIAEIIVIFLCFAAFVTEMSCHIIQRSITRTTDYQKEEFHPCDIKYPCLHNWYMFRTVPFKSFKKHYNDADFNVCLEESAGTLLRWQGDVFTSFCFVPRILCNPVYVLSGVHLQRHAQQKKMMKKKRWFDRLMCRAPTDLYS